METDNQVKVAVYRHFAETGHRPSVSEVAKRSGRDTEQVLESYGRLRSQRVLVLEADGRSIRMAPPFSGVPTQHIVEAAGQRYFANCAWDALGIVAALATPATIHSRCEQTCEILELKVRANGPETSDWFFHSLVPAAKWWDNIVFT